ncbi:MAG: carbonic anhydrase [Calothrix sp. C42_A2020_038]|nr:carbonic anhydrase [Calothrix sp. C42_A2020_038]
MAKINGFIGRRNLLKLVGTGSVSIVTTAITNGLLNQEAASAGKNLTLVNKPKPVSPEQALKRLLEGNQRFIRDKRLISRQSKLRLLETAVAQFPHTSILGCADSRVPAEIIFDQGFGDLFVVRVAGNVASQTAIGSLEFASTVLGSQLIVVLGHTQCGAVTAAIKNEPLPGRMGTFVEEIKPAVQSIKSLGGNLEKNATIANVRHQVNRLCEGSTTLSNLVNQGKLRIVGCMYDLATGKATFLN